MKQIAENNSLYQVLEGLKTGAFTSAELVDYYTSRIEKYNSRFHAVISLNPEASEQARICDEKRRSGAPIGKLEGVPIVVKDCINVTGMPATSGCAFLKNYYPSQDATTVARLKNEGAIILAKTNLTEFAMGGMGNSSMGGQTVNPYDCTRTAGGSSSGSAVSIACDFAAAAIGTDTVNSVRSPSSATSAVGLRPTWGSIDNRGSLPSKPSQDTCGPMGRTVADVAYLFDIIKDDSTVTCDYDRINSFERVRFGLVTNFVNSEEVDVTEIVKHTVDCIRRAGGEVVDFAMPEIDTGVLSREYDTGNLGVYDVINDFYKESSYTLDDFVASDLVCPEVQTRLIGAIEGRCADAREKINARLALKDGLVQKLLIKMDELGVDALLYPHQSSLVAKIGAAAQKGRNGILAAITGFPAIVIPGGFTSPNENAPLGVPVGMELFSRPDSEKQLFSLADFLERTLNAHIPPII